MDSMKPSRENKKEMGEFLNTLMDSSDKSTEADLIRIEQRMEERRAEAEAILNAEEVEDSQMTMYAISSETENIEAEKPYIDADFVSEEFKDLLEKNAKKNENPGKQNSRKNRKEKDSKDDAKKDKKTFGSPFKKIVDSNVINIENLNPEDFAKLPLYEIHKTLFKQLPADYIAELKLKTSGKSEEELVANYKNELKVLNKDKKRRTRSLMAAALDEKIMRSIYNGDHESLSLFNSKFKVSSVMAITLAIIGVLFVINASNIIGFLLAALLTSAGIFSYRRYRKLIKILRNK